MIGLMVVPSLVAPRTTVHFVTFLAGPMLGSLLALIWWVGFARVRGTPRWLVPAAFLVPAFVAGTFQIMLGEGPISVLVYGLPIVLLVWIVWVALSGSLLTSTRATCLYVLLVVSWSVFSLLRVDGASSNIIPEFSWRWNMKPEDLAAKETKDRPLVAAAPIAAQVYRTDWAEFRGPNRDDKVVGLSIATDWAQDKPVQLWRQRIGPGWGSFAVVGERLFTQEQRGNDEAVVCYDAKTGGEIWRHFEKAKFTESIAGAGPRATPTVHEGRVYAQGATGLLVCLDGNDGKLIWKTDIREDAGGILPQWGYASSPLVINGNVIVYTGGLEGKGTSAFSATDGKWKWSSGDAKHGYSSAQRTTIAGVEQVLMLSDYGLESFDPNTGTRLWENRWTLPTINRSTQPAVIAEGEFLIGTGAGSDLGARRIKVTKTAHDWDVREVWVTRKLKPYFNDGVIHAGYFYGFSDSAFVCIDLVDGKEKWNAGTIYGHGQVVLLADQGLLVVQAITGKVHLVKATPEDHIEEAKLDAISGKTWNHPVVAGGRLYVRNGTEAAAYELKLK